MIGTKLWLVVLEEWDGREFMGRTTWGPFLDKPTPEEARAVAFRSLVDDACEDGAEGAEAREEAAGRIDEDGNDLGVEEFTVADLKAELNRA